MGETIASGSQQILSEHGYDLLERVGVGSFGEVHSVASRRYPGVIFVAKFVRFLDETGTDAIRGLFEREVSILCKLDHPHIVSIFDCFECGEDFVLILEYCTQGTIDLLIKTEHYTEAQIIPLMQQILSGLAQCHQLGIAHRDIKPANILIDKYGRAKLADFGLSCFVRGSELDFAAGSRAYMAPELDHNRSSPDLFRADIWSLGVTFYVLLVGENPWARPAKRSKLSSGHISVDAIVKFPDGFSQDLKDFLLRMLCIVPSQRATAADLLADPLFGRSEVALAKAARAASVRAIARPVSPAPLGPRRARISAIRLSRPTILTEDHPY
jgi:serine/threonine protein kinase